MAVAGRLYADNHGQTLVSLKMMFSFNTFSHTLKLYCVLHCDDQRPVPAEAWPQGHAPVAETRTALRTEAIHCNVGGGNMC